MNVDKEKWLDTITDNNISPSAAKAALLYRGDENWKEFVWGYFNLRKHLYYLAEAGQVVKKTNAASLYNAMFSNDGENRNLEVSRLTGLPEDHPSIGIIERFYGFGKVGHQGGLQHVLRLIKRDLNDFNVDFKKYDDLMSNDAIFSAVYDDKPFNLFPPISHPQ